MRESKFQFRDPYLEELYFVEHEEFDIGEVNIEMKNSTNTQVTRSVNDNSAKVELTLEINIDNKEAPFELRIKFSSYFRWEDLDEKAVEDLLKYNAPALLLGYMRPIVAGITSSSRFPTYNLPFINFME